MDNPGQRSMDIIRDILREFPPGKFIVIENRVEAIHRAMDIAEKKMI